MTWSTASGITKQDLGKILFQTTEASTRMQSKGLNSGRVRPHAGRLNTIQPLKGKYMPPVEAVVTRTQPVEREAPAQQLNILDAFTNVRPGQLAQQFISSLPQIYLSRRDAMQVLGEVQTLHEQRQGQGHKSDQPPEDEDTDITPFLTPVGTWELKHMRKLSHLTSLTYRMSKLTPRKLLMAHGLELVTTSWRSEVGPQGSEVGPQGSEVSCRECMDDGYGACMSVADIQVQYPSASTPVSDIITAITSSTTIRSDCSKGSSDRSDCSKGSSDRSDCSKGSSDRSDTGAALPTPTTPTSTTPATTTPPATPATPPDPTWASHTHLMAARVSEAAGAAAAAAAYTASFAAAAATPLAASLYSTIAALALPLALPGALTLPGALPLPVHLTPPGGLALGLAALPPAPAAAAASVRAGERGEAGGGGVSTTAEQPSDWFVCDDPATSTRYVVIQGSHTLDHWRLNLRFEPVALEGAGTGVWVHRGVYEAAKVLLAQLHALVVSHVKGAPTARVCFTGHSIGGALATLLALMCVARGVLAPHQLAPLYTFGAPAVLHTEGGAADANDADVEADNLPAVVATSDAGDIHGASSGEGAPLLLLPERGPGAMGVPGPRPDSLLARLGLGEGSVRNVMMHRDVVPRSLTSDCSRVAHLLQSWGPGLSHHPGLACAGRKHMYEGVGRVVVVQPDAWHWFVGEPDHPLLPKGPGAYTLRSPTAPPRPGLPTQAPVEQPWEREGEDACGDVRGAVRALMDRPHPIDTLGDPGAYLAAGSISRYHNPENYTAALGRLIHLGLRAEGRQARTLRTKPPHPSHPPAAARVAGGGGHGADGAVAAGMSGGRHDQPAWGAGMACYDSSCFDMHQGAGGDVGVLGWDQAC